jgi:hypothetical protein
MIGLELSDDQVEAAELWWSVLSSCMHHLRSEYMHALHHVRAWCAVTEQNGRALI